MQKQGTSKEYAKNYTIEYLVSSVREKECRAVEQRDKTKRISKRGKYNRYGQQKTRFVVFAGTRSLLNVATIRTAAIPQTTNLHNAKLFGKFFKSHK